MKKIFLIILFVAVLVGGSFFVQQTVFAQVLGGKILPASALAASPPGVDPLGRIFPFFYHVIGIPRPSLPMGVICAICLGPAGVGRWFLGRAVGGIVIIGGLGGF